MVVLSYERDDASHVQAKLGIIGHQNADRDSPLVIFEPFQSNFEGGTGLGLALVFQIVQAHKGRVYAISTPGEGAEFVVEIPQAQAPPRALSVAEKRVRASMAVSERVNG